jgi:AcrR family transcriptional regulator
VPRQRRSDGHGAGQSRQGVENEARWNEILRAAAEEFYETGFRAARLQDIAARVDLQAGSLYYYIDSKEDLLFALVQTTHQLGLETTHEDSATQAMEAPGRLAAFIQREMQLMHDLEARSGAVERDLALLAPEQRAKIVEMRDHLQGFVRGILEQGIEEGHFDASIDLGIATSMVFGLLNKTPEWARKDGRLSWSEIGEFYTRLITRGLAKPIPTTAAQ